MTLLSITAAFLSAQDQGRFTGTVADTSGAVIPGATVKVRNEKTGADRTVTTSESGVFFVTNLAAASYTITASSAGLNDAVYKETNLSVGQERTLNIVMQPTTVTSEVTVSAGELAVVETSSASVGANISAREVAQMPINGRQISQLYLLAPGEIGRAHV